jgi:Leucine-rich repeat (LRR) protein
MRKDLESLREEPRIESESILPELLEELDCGFDRPGQVRIGRKLYSDSIDKLEFKKIHLTAIDLHNLQRFSNLVELEMEECLIADLRPLSRLSGLAKLNLSGSNISDLRPLAGLSNLSALDLRNNKIRDASPLSALPNKSSGGAS